MKRHHVREWLAGLLVVSLLGLGPFARAEFSGTKERAEFSKCGPQLEFTLALVDRPEAITVPAHAKRGRTWFGPLTMGTLVATPVEKLAEPALPMPVLVPIRRPEVVGVIELRL